MYLLPGGGGAKETHRRTTVRMRVPVFVNIVSGVFPIKNDLVLYPR